MAVVIPGPGCAARNDSASGAQVIDGSLKFNDDDSPYLERDIGADGNRRTWTFSAWTKRSNIPDESSIFSAEDGSTKTEFIRFNTDGTLQYGLYNGSSYDWKLISNAVYRDPSAWYHIVLAFDSTQDTESDRVKIYVNGAQITSFGTGDYPSKNDESYVNESATYEQHWIGRSNQGYMDALLADVHFIDGQALTPSYFGFTDPLTNTWRPKKYSGTFTGTNTFYLPMDGNLPIGKDQSGNGNDWTPINFGGCNSSASATVSIDTPRAGALPINNTVSGGRIATSGHRTDPHASSLVLAIPGVGNVNDYSATIKGSGTNKTVTNNGVTFPTTKSHYYGSAIYSDGSNSEFEVGSSTEADFAFAGEFTWEMWWYPISSGATTHARAWYFGATDGTGGGSMHWYTSGNVNMYGDASNSPLGGSDICTGTVTMDVWNHIAVTRDDANKVRIFLNGILAGTTTNSNDVASGKRTLYIGGPAYETAQYWQDIRLYNGACKYKENFNLGSTNPDILPETPSGVAYGSELTKPTGGAVGFDGTGDYLTLGSSSDVAFGTGEFTIDLWFYNLDTGAASSQRGVMQVSDTAGGLSSTYTNGWFIGTGVKADGSTNDNAIRFTLGDGPQTQIGGIQGTPNTWYHIAVTRDGSNVIRMFVDGVLIDNVTNAYDFSSTNLAIGGYYSTSYNTKGYISNVRLIKGTALYTASFTPPTSPLTNITNTKLLCCQGSNAVNYAVSPGAITANGGAKASAFNPFDTDIDTVRGKPTGYCTLNPLNTGGLFTLSDGNLKGVSSGSYGCQFSTIGVTSGKWYAETTVLGTSIANACGIARFDHANTYPGASSSDFGYAYLNDGRKATVSDARSTYGSTWQTIGDIIGIAFDADNGTVRFYNNGIDQGIAFSTIDTSNGLHYFVQFDDSNTGNSEQNWNFGQKPFKFPPPEGFQPLNYANLPSPGVVRPDQYVGVTTYTGNGGTNTIDCGFKPDLVAVKGRANAWDWGVFDVVRSTAGNVYDYLSFNASGAQATGGTTALQSYNTTGFTLGADAAFNTNDATFVAYTWKAGGNKGTWNIDDVAYASAAAAGLTGPTGASVGTRQGFSILQYTGTGGARTISHGLGKKPDFWLVKDWIGANDWVVYHSAYGAEKYFAFNSTGYVSDASDVWNDTEPTSSVFSLGTSNIINGNSDGSNYKYVAYLWANVPGLQKFGKFAGNGDNSGTYVELGFRPALVIIKRADSGTCNWGTNDDQRLQYNQTWGNDLSLYVNSNGVESSSSSLNVDFLSSGIKLRSNNTCYNTTGGTYIYMAWAYQPMNNLYGAQSNAR